MSTINQAPDHPDFQVQLGGHNFSSQEKRSATGNVASLECGAPQGAIMANPFVHVELNAADPEKAKAFYSNLFQWQLSDVPNPAVPTSTYTTINVGEGTGGGIMKQIAGGPSGWLAYVEVDNIRAATKRAESLGAEIMKDVTEVMGMGWLSFIRDPTGAVLGLWQPASK
jgi:uncharacterized protein